MIASSSPSLPAESCSQPNVKATPPKGLLQREDPIAERFLSYFYASCIETMYQPLNDVPEFKNANGTSSSLNFSWNPS